MKKLLISIIILTLLISACTKEESPFTPKDPDAEVDYDFAVYPNRFEHGNWEGQDEWHIECNAYSPSPYVASFEIFTSENGNDWIPYTGDKYNYGGNDNFNMAYNGYQPIQVYRNISEPFNYIDPLNISLTNIPWVEGMKTRYSYNCPIIKFEIYNTNEFFITHHYKVSAIDVYGRKTAQKIKSIRFCRVQVEFRTDDPWNPGGWREIHAIGTVVGVSGDIYTIEVEYPDFFFYDISSSGAASLTRIWINDLYNDWQREFAFYNGDFNQIDINIDLSEGKLHQQNQYNENYN